MASARIAIVGGGIAGVGAAWALCRAGRDVDLFESSPELGGNARTHTWHTRGRSFTSGLAVLAWPERYFRNYGRLLAELSIATEPVQLRFFIRRGSEVFAQPAQGGLAERHREDLRRWRRMVEVVRSVNRRVSGVGPPSLYRVSYANPLTYVPAYRLARLWGISRAFWDDVIVALYSSSFLTSRLEALPAVILPTIDDLISVEQGGAMRSWSTHSGEVFDKMVAGLRGVVHRDTAIVGVRADAASVELVDQRGERRRYDQVVLAASAVTMARALDAEAHRDARRLLAGITYVEASDPSFMAGFAHADASVLPPQHRAEILSGYCTFVDVLDHPRRYENHFVVSSWAPIARGTDAVMLVSYNQPAGRTFAGETRAFSNRGAHPDLSIANLLRARRLRRLQGRDRLHYCGSYTTPGNGHDLSLLSGLVVANALGAPYPFSRDVEARADFDLLRRMMLLT